MIEADRIDGQRTSHEMDLRIHVGEAVTYGRDAGGRGAEVIPDVAEGPKADGPLLNEWHGKLPLRALLIPAVCITIGWD